MATLARISSFETWHLVTNQEGTIKVSCGRTIRSRMENRNWILWQNADKKHVNCKNCLRDMKASERTEQSLPASKYCNKCKTEKPRIEFYVVRYTSSGNIDFSCWCKDCMSAYQRERRRKRKMVNIRGEGFPTSESLRRLRAEAKGA